VKPPALDGGTPPLESISEGDIVLVEEGRSSPSLLSRNGEPDLSKSSKRRNEFCEPVAPKR